MSEVRLEVPGSLTRTYTWLWWWSGSTGFWGRRKDGHLLRSTRRFLETGSNDDFSKRTTSVGYFWFSTWWSLRVCDYIPVFLVLISFFTVVVSLFCFVVIGRDFFTSRCFIVDLFRSLMSEDFVYVFVWPVDLANRCCRILEIGSTDHF